jgi:hypothetical protein
MLRSPATEWLASDAAMLYEESGASSYDSFPAEELGRYPASASASTSSAAAFLATQTDDAIRWLVTGNDEANNNSSSTNATGSNSTSTGDDGTASASTVLRDTFVVYGTVLGVLLLVFCCVRVKFPRPYTIRKWVEEVKVRAKEV